MTILSPARAPRRSLAFRACAAALLAACSAVPPQRAAPPAPEAASTAPADTRPAAQPAPPPPAAAAAASVAASASKGTKSKKSGGSGAATGATGGGALTRGNTRGIQDAGGGEARADAGASPPPGAPAGALRVPVYFATDRQFISAAAGYGALPNRAGPAVSYGSVVVSVPEKYRHIGELPVPAWYNVLSKNDPDKYVIVGAVSVLPAGDFFDRLRSSVRDNPGRRAAFVYIHGYSNSFSDAAMRTAQIAVDLHIPIVPAFYSWPSRGRQSGYADDEESAAWSASHLQAFLVDFAERSAADDIYVIAHSMGTRPTVAALANLLEQRPALRARFKQIILAAPDINADIFRDDIAPRFAKWKAAVTVYASSRDRALRLSDHYHGWARLGDVNGPITGIAGVEIIDASTIDTDFIGHGYFSDERALLTDIAALFTTGLPASGRAGLVGVPSARPRYWAFP